MAQIEYKYVVSSPVLYEAEAAPWNAPPAGGILNEVIKLPWVKVKEVCSAPDKCEPAGDMQTGKKTNFKWRKLVDTDSNNIVGIYAAASTISPGAVWDAFSKVGPTLIGIMSLKGGDTGILSPTHGVQAKVVNKINAPNNYYLLPGYKAVGILSNSTKYISVSFGPAQSKGAFTKALPLVALVQSDVVAGDDTSKEHYNSYTRILDLMLYQTIKSYLL